MKLVRTKKPASPASKSSPTSPEKFALKVLDRSKFESKREEGYVFNERNMMLEIDHHFHVKLINTFKSPLRLYLLMEYVPGDTLASRIERGNGLPEPVACFYAANFVIALHYLHQVCPISHLPFAFILLTTCLQRGIMHRDVKPSNTLIGSDGYLRLCDYGFSRQLPLGETTRTIAGTYAYLHPAQCRDEEYDHSVDLWAMGVSVYEMLYGVSAPYLSVALLGSQFLRFADYTFRSRRGLPL